MATRVLEIEEYKKIIHLLNNGFRYGKNDEQIFRPNAQVSLALQLEATLGLRIGDVLNLKVNNFKNGKLELREDKTEKLQYREINKDVYYFIKEYCVEHNLMKDSHIFNISVRGVQKQLKIVTDYLMLENIGTHSFRKMFATTAYENNTHNIELVKELLNHSSVAVTQKYIQVSQQKIDYASSQINFMVNEDNNLE